MCKIQGSFWIIYHILKRLLEQESRTGSAWKWGGGKVAQTMYTHVSKCKNYKIKNKIK
jgi:hypothetical protein